MRGSNVLHMQIEKKLIDDHHLEIMTVPHCEIVAKWLKREQQVKPLVHTVNILGTTEDDDYFTINIDPPAQNGNYIDKIFGGWLEICSCAAKANKEDIRNGANNKVLTDITNKSTECEGSI